MTKFVINKTSFEMFDIFRAYGLAFLISGFENRVETHIHDMGNLFLIKVDGDIPKNADSKLFEEVGSSWPLVFKTFRKRKDLKVKPPIEEAERIVISEYDKILDIHRKYDFFPIFGKKVSEGRTFYQTMDVSAAKGYREEKRDTYHDGSQIEVDKYSWVLASIGAAWFGIWPQNLMRRDASFLMCMVPNPKKVLLMSHRDVQNALDKRLCIVSANTSLIHYSVKLAQFTCRKSDEIEYDSVVFNVMQKTGQQPKPSGGGRYTLDLLYNLAKTPEGFKALEKIDKFLLPIDPRIKGIRQDIALAVTDFLMRPSLDNLRRFESLYIRGMTNKKNKFFPWDKPQLEEMLRYVEIA